MAVGQLTMAFVAPSTTESKDTREVQPHTRATREESNERSALPTACFECGPGLADRQEAATENEVLPAVDHAPEMASKVPALAMQLALPPVQ